MSEVENVTVDQLPESATVLDVREDYEWDEGHIANAVHVPLNELPSRAEELDPDTDVYVICRTGGRSSKASAWLEGQGYSAYNVSGGMGAWQDAERPMVSENGEAPKVR